MPPAWLPKKQNPGNTVKTTNNAFIKPVHKEAAEKIRKYLLVNLAVFAMRFHISVHRMAPLIDVANSRMKRQQVHVAGPKETVSIMIEVVFYLQV